VDTQTVRTGVVEPLPPPTAALVLRSVAPPPARRRPSWLTSSRWRAPETALALVALVVAVGVLVRLTSPSALWLDEALSVDIASLPLRAIPEALRHDGAPPLYYVLLHGWIALLGTGAVAVRALSVLLSLAALPLAWLCGRRLHSRFAGTTALLLLAANPFAVRYATETRMYALVVLLVLAGVLALHAALRSPTPPHLLAVALLSGLLALTHYWTLFLLAVVGAGLAVAAVRGRERRTAQRCLAALVAGGVLFLPWLPSFLYQSAHTGAPWSKPPGAALVLTTWQQWGGTGLPAAALGLLLLLLALAAPFARRWRGADGREGVVLRLPVRRTGALLVGTALATLLLGLLVTIVQSSGYALRYSAVALPPALLAATLGAQALPRRLRTAALVAAVALGSVGTLSAPFDRDRKQAADTAAVLRPLLRPGDLVVYCPDQLGPAVSRLLPSSTDQLVFPTGGRPELVDWVDYAARNARSDPGRYAATASRRASGAIYLVLGSDYRTYGDSCTRLDAALTATRHGRRVLQRPQKHFLERMAVVRYPAAVPPQQ
jgi:mannosyltransferase